MPILISPAKTLDFQTPAKYERFSQPAFLADTEILVNRLRTLSPTEISSLMKVSQKLGKLNAERF